MNVLNDDNPYAFPLGGVSVVMGDGSVTFVGEGINAAVFGVLVSPAGGDVAPTP